MSVVEGKLAFENLDTHEMYQGQSTGKYSVVISLSDSVADDLAAKGVKMREYEGTKQRKFSTKYDVPVVDKDGQPFMGRIGRGSTVRRLFTLRERRRHGYKDPHTTSEVTRNDRRSSSDTR